MKTELQITEELINEKTKEYIQANALLMRALEKNTNASFGAVEEIFTLQESAERLEGILADLHAQRQHLLGDLAEEEVIIGSKEQIVQCLNELPDGIYKLVKKVERKESDGKE